MWMNVKISIWLFFLSCSAADGFFLNNNILSTSWLSTKQSNRKVCQRSFVISRTITPISWHLNCFQRGSPRLMAAQRIDNRPINLVLIAQQVRTTGYDFLFHSVSLQLSAVHSTLSGLTPHLPVTHKCPPLPLLGSKCTLVRRQDLRFPKAFFTGVPVCWIELIGINYGYKDLYLIPGSLTSFWSFGNWSIRSEAQGSELHKLFRILRCVGNANHTDNQCFSHENKFLEIKFYGKSWWKKGNAFSSWAEMFPNEVFSRTRRK